MTRRHTPGSAQKLGRSHRERDHYEEDERESFPQFWYVMSLADCPCRFMLANYVCSTTCEKQFVPSDEKHLYCSET